MTTTNLHLTRSDRARAWLAQRDPIALGSMIVLALIILVSLLRARLDASATIARVPTPSLPIIMIATAPAELPPTAVPPRLASYQPLERYVVAFAAPDGAVLGAIPAPAASAITARYGADWLMTRWEDSDVWIRAADIGMQLADLAPQRAPPVVYVSAPEEAVEQPVQAAPTPAQDYQVLSERQQNIQGRLVEPVYPTLAPMEQNNVTQAWARQQYLAEHPEVTR